MTRRTIKYTYRSFTLSCQCCSDSESYYDMWENGVMVRNYIPCDILCDEEELHEYFKHYEPFDTHSECEFF